MDVFGKELKEFRQRPDCGHDSTPLIFWLLAGYFRKNDEHIKSEGIFRVNGSEPAIRDLELHMSQGNFNYLKKVANVHTVTNYWKRLLREMKQPLIPFQMYEQFHKIKEKVESERLPYLKELINELDTLHFNTLHFHIEFFKDIVKHEPYNKMTSYNVAVTVGPNIFRPLVARPTDLANHGVFYDVIIKMIDKCDILFNKEIQVEELIFMMPDMMQDDNMSHGAVGSVNVAVLDKITAASEEEPDLMAQMDLVRERESNTQERGADRQNYRDISEAMPEINQFNRSNNDAEGSSGTNTI